MKKILFVCLGNICRSSTAEGVMLHLIKEAGLENEFVIDSAGILSYHQGELPDSRMRAHAARRGYQLVHRSRPVRTEDFYHFDLIIGMDDRNIDDLKDKAPSLEEWKKIHRMTEYCTRIPAEDIRMTLNSLKRTGKLKRMTPAQHWHLRKHKWRCWKLCRRK